MGSVWLASDSRLNRQVALKTLLAADDEGSHGRARLLREARAVAALNHPNIATVFDVLEEDDNVFLVFEYVDGETLSARIARGPMAVADAVGIACQIARALSTAHAHGVVHRDLKPGNVMLGPDGQVKVLDFGIARLLTTGTTTAATGPATSGPGFIGTPAYAAPEQMVSSAVDERADLYALGVMLFEMIGGRLPFPSHDPASLATAKLSTNAPALSSTGQLVPPDLDELVGALLARDLGVRPASAQTVLERLQAMPGVPVSGPSSSRRRPSSRTARAIVAVGAAIVLVVGVIAGGPWWPFRTGLSPPPPAAEAWYVRGIEAVRQGATATGRKALEEAVRLHPSYALAHSRLAEVLSDLDEERAAQAALIRVSALVSDESRLPAEDRLRLDAIRAMVLRDFDRAIADYTELAKANPADPGGLVDLGRAQEAAGQLADARGSYQRATTLDSQFASGFLRLGAVLGDVGHLSDALTALDEADRLFGLASNVEGRVETTLKRGALLDAAGRFDETAKAAEEARRLAQQAGLVSHEIRAGFQRGSAQVGSGQFLEGENTVRASVDRALAAGLQGTAADGLIDMAGTLLVRGRFTEADAALVRATTIATDRSLTRTAMRATTQRAALKLQQGQPREALSLLEDPLRYFAEARYRRLEAVALTIAARANQDMGDYSSASAQISKVLAFAAESHNDELTAQARSSLSTLAASQGRLPEALGHRVEAERLRRALGDTETLPYDLANHAEVLIRLGRGRDAAGLLDELDAGIAAGIGAYPTRARRVAMLRAFQAVTEGRFEAARRHSADVDRPGAPPSDETGQFATMLRAVAAASLGLREPVPPLMPDLDQASPAGREVRLWRVVALLASGAARQAATEVSQLLREIESAGDTEFEWRAAALAATAKLRSDRPVAQRRAEQAMAALERLSGEWGRDMAAYRARRDVSTLLAALGQFDSRPIPGTAE